LTNVGPGRRGGAQGLGDHLLLIGASAGDVVPGQIGALEGAFSFLADAVGTTRRQGVAIALLIHLVQLAWVLVGFVVFALGRAKARPTPASATRRGVLVVRASLRA